MYDRILVAIDGGSTAARGLAEAIALAKVTGARIRLLHVIDKSSLMRVKSGVDSATLDDELKSEAEEILAQAERRVELAGLEADTVLGNSLGGCCLRELVAAQVTGWDADLIVLGTHGRRGIRRAVLGSDAEEIVRTSTVPVLLVRAP